jgi:uncharacterized membrane protein
MSRRLSAKSGATGSIILGIAIATLAWLLWPPLVAGVSRDPSQVAYIVPPQPSRLLRAMLVFGLALAGAGTFTLLRLRRASETRDESKR